jgi:hypothetical protein
MGAILGRWSATLPYPVVEESPVILEQPLETHFRRRRLQIQHSISDHFTHHWSMFETVAGASANDPDVFRFGMAIQNKIVVRGVFILANPALKQRGASHFWKAHAQIGACGASFCWEISRSMVLGSMTGAASVPQ